MKKVFAITLSFLLIAGILAGCAGSASPAPSAAPANSSSPASAAPAASGSPEEAANGTSDTLEKISDSGITWTMYKPSHTVIGTQIDTWNDTLFAKEMEKRTGVHIDFITPVLGQEEAQFQLLISSGEYPDFVSETNKYKGGGEALINDGIIVDLAQHLDKLPNFAKNLNATELRKKEVYTDTGKISGFPAFYENDEESEVFVGLLVRKDLLDAAGLDIPVTYDDWHTMLTTFKNQFGLKKGFVPGPEMFGQNNMWSVGYGFGYVDYFGSELPFYQRDGKVRYAPIDDSDSFKAYIEMMAKWYAEGLLDPDFQGVTDVNAQIAAFSSVDTGACITAYSLAPLLSMIASANKEDFSYVCVPVPVLEAGQTPHMYAETSRIDLNQILITTKCKDLDLALKYWDQYYTAEGSLLAGWGIEGETFANDANGKPQWTDTIVSNPDYNFVSMRHALMSSVKPGVFERRASNVEAQSIANDEMYRTKGDNSYRISRNVTLTEEENDVYLSYMTDINNYVKEKCIMYILGRESLDGFDKMVEDVKAMNIGKVIEVYQTALDRYNAR